MTATRMATQMRTAAVEIELSSARLDARGMVRDFDDIKRTIQRWIDETLDHTTVLRKDDPLIRPLREHGQRLFLMAENPTAEAIARLIFEYARSQRLPVTQVRLWETTQSVATYRPRRGAVRRPRRRRRAAAVRSTSTAA